jgi:neutral ceramidase
VLVGAPFEITVESGRRVQAAVLAATRKAGIGDVVVSSVANEYWGYCATPEEYELQYYEGGHTLHGPSTQPWLAAQLARLAAEVVDRGAVSDAGYRAFALPSRRYLPRSSGVAVERRADGPAEFHDPDRTDEGYWEVRWHDVAAGDLRWHEPLARVELDDGTVVADDQGTRVAVLQLRPGTYAARWYGPPLGQVPKHRFVLPANAGQPEIRTELFG